MTSIHIDDLTAKGLEQLAIARGLSVEAYLRALVEESQKPGTPSEMTLDFDQELRQLLFTNGSLPADFGRADVYADHD